jgi:hypothetical protein
MAYSFGKTSKQDDAADTPKRTIATGRNAAGRDETPPARTHVAAMKGTPR